MDSFQLWKDDYRREVEEVLAERRRARERGEPQGTMIPGEGFAGRLADLVVPPAGIHAENDALRDRLEKSAGVIRDLRARTEAAEAASLRERDRRERIKDVAARMAVDLRQLQAELLVAREHVRLSQERVAAAESAAKERAGLDAASLRDARLEAMHGEARAADAERASIARLQAVRGVEARLDAALLELEAKNARIETLEKRLELAREAAKDAEARVMRKLSMEDVEKRMSDSEDAARKAEARADLALDEARRESFRRASLEEALRAEAARAAAAESAADEAVEKAKSAESRAETIVAAARAESAQAHEQAAAVRAEADRIKAEADLAADAARRLEAELPSRVAAAIGEERAKVESIKAAAAKALEKAAFLENRAIEVRAEIDRRLADERARIAQESSQLTQAAFNEGLAAERTRAEHAERELERSRRAEEEATQKSRETVRALSDYRDRMKDLAARLNERVARERGYAEQMAAELLRREAESLARVQADAGRRGAELDEVRAMIRAEMEEERAKLEAEVDAERAALQERWREQADLLEKLRQSRGRNPEQP
jgi:hypothetical protein